MLRHAMSRWMEFPDPPRPSAMTGARILLVEGFDEEEEDDDDDEPKD